MNDLWMNHLSVDAWLEPSKWSGYFEEAERLLGLPLTHLDVNDPVRRKVASVADAGAFVCAFEDREDTRWLLGKCGRSGIRLTIQHSRQLDQWPNSLMWHLPLRLVEKPDTRQRLKALFDLGNRTFKPFYAYSDDVAQITSKKKSSGAVDIQAELLGVFWLTYFNGPYVALFGKEKFNGIPGVEHGSNGSVTILLDDTPQSVTSETREQAVAVLGKHSFVDPSDMLGKQRGRFALTFQQLLAHR